MYLHKPKTDIYINIYTCQIQKKKDKKKRPIVLRPKTEKKKTQEAVYWCKNRKQNRC